MTQQTSEKRTGEAKEPLFSDAVFDRMFGVIDKRSGKCEEHGDYVDVYFSGEKNAPKGWKGCPECSRIAHEETRKREEQERQAEMYRERIERTVNLSGIPARFKEKTFDNFEAVNRKAENHLAKVKSYADLVCSEDHEGRCLLMLGKVGNGKTHLACALLAHTIRTTGHACHYWTFSELVRAVKGSFAKGAEYSEEEVYRDFARPRLVVLDEVGMQNFTDFEQAVAYEAVNARYLAQRPTVVISNLQAKDLPLCIGERVVDRLREGGGRALDFDWKSYRVGGAA